MGREGRYFLPCQGMVVREVSILREPCAGSRSAVPVDGARRRFARRSGRLISGRVLRDIIRGFLGLGGRGETQQKRVCMNPPFSHAAAGKMGGLAFTPKIPTETDLRVRFNPGQAAKLERASRKNEARMPAARIEGRVFFRGGIRQGRPSTGFCTPMPAPENLRGICGRRPVCWGEPGAGFTARCDCAHGPVSGRFSAGRISGVQGLPRVIIDIH